MKKHSKAFSVPRSRSRALEAEVGPTGVLLQVAGRNWSNCRRERKRVRGEGERKRKKIKKNKKKKEKKKEKNYLGLFGFSASYLVRFCF